jgi:hypothetical protein
MIGAVAIILILLVASIPKVPVSQQYVTTTQTQSFMTTQFQTVTQTVQTSGPSPLMEYCFSPGGNCASVIVKWIDRANSSIHILIYEFSLSQIGDAIIRAKQRNPNMDIRIAWDNSELNVAGSQYQRLPVAALDISFQ